MDAGTSDPEVPGPADVAVDTGIAKACMDGVLLILAQGMACDQPGMLQKSMILIILLALAACEQEECVDCADNAGNVFTFCDPAESPIDSLECGDVYKKRK